MSTSQQTPRRRQESLKQIEHMLAERDAMLRLLWKASGRESSLPHAPQPDLLKDFTSLLTDYLAAAHFGLYQRFAEGTERRQAVRRVAEQVYARIGTTTQAALDFVDRYAERGNAHLDPKLPDDLGKLADLLAERMRLEDQLIDVMLDRTAKAPSA